jgi:hypothetical protein
LIDEHFVGYSGHGDSFEACVEEALNSDLYDPVSPLDIAEIRYLCRDSAFSTVSTLFSLLSHHLLLLSQRGSENIAARSRRLIDVMNICLRSNPSEDHFQSTRRLSNDLGIPMSRLCPTSMKGLFWRNGSVPSPVPLKILVFPGSEVSSFLSRANFPNDGRHYGLGMDLPFKRSLQGIAHEYAKATPDQESSVIALYEERELIDSIQDRAEKAWERRLNACYSGMNLPEMFRIHSKQ